MSWPLHIFILPVCYIKQIMYLSMYFFYLFFVLFLKGFVVQHDNLSSQKSACQFTRPSMGVSNNRLGTESKEL